MQKMCDVCRKRVATLFDGIVRDGVRHEYAYCEECYNRILKCGGVPNIVAQSRIDMIGKECDTCGRNINDFESSLLFGCSDCYTLMRDYARETAIKLQGIQQFNLRHLYTPCDVFEEPKKAVANGKFKSADECSIDELTAHNVVSSRIRFARNIRGLNFPKYIDKVDVRAVELINGVKRAVDKITPTSLVTMRSLSKEKKMALVERHLISLPLANNTSCGAVVLEGGKKFGGVSIMINEEDHIREQYILDGYNLDGVYKNIKQFDDAIISELDIAYDNEFGFLTACPTNLGTGMRASVMIFLPALKRAGAIDDALKTFKDEFGITVRGVFGEGSDAEYDMYQISNSRTLCISEREIIEQVKGAVVRMCYLERVALERLVRERSTELFDRIARSYGLLSSAYTLTSKELNELLIDVKLGVILGLLPIKNMDKLNEMIWACTKSSLSIITGGNDVSARDIARAKIVRDILAEER